MTNADADADIDRTNAATGVNWRTANDARKRRTILFTVGTCCWRRFKVGEEEGMLPTLQWKKWVADRLIEMWNGVEADYYVARVRT